MSQTLFGAPWSSPAATASVLRACAWAQGVSPAPTTETDLAAAAIAANVWCAVVGRSSLADLSGLHFEDVAVATRILAFSAGVVDVRPPDRALPCPVPDALELRVSAAAEEAASWAGELLGQPSAANALLASASLLSGYQGAKWQYCVMVLSGLAA